MSCEPESKQGEKGLLEVFPAVDSGGRMHLPLSSSLLPKAPGDPQKPCLLLCPTFLPPAACLQPLKRAEMKSWNKGIRVAFLPFSTMENSACWEKGDLGGPVRLWI